MTITTQKTPNPNALKFILPEKKFSRPLNVSVEDETDHPLALRLLALDPVYNVFMVQDFVTVNKLPDAPWEELEPTVQQIIQDYFGLS